MPYTHAPLSPFILVLVKIYIFHFSMNQYYSVGFFLVKKKMCRCCCFFPIVSIYTHTIHSSIYQIHCQQWKKKKKKSKRQNPEWISGLFIFVGVCVFVNVCGCCVWKMLSKFFGIFFQPFLLLFPYFILSFKTDKIMKMKREIRQSNENNVKRIIMSFFFPQ